MKKGGTIMIIRPDYINAITPYIDTPLVKILAGVRRCGKSTILEMMKEELIRRGIKKENIIFRKYNEMEIDDGFSAKDMYDELKGIIIGKADVICFLMSYRKSMAGRKQSTVFWKEKTLISMSQAPIPN